MTVITKRTIRIAGALLAAGALVAGSQSVATSAPAGSAHLGDPPVITVDMTTDGGFSLPSTVQAGFVTFKVSSPEPGFHALQGFSLKPGVTLDQVKREIDDALSGDPAIVPAAIAALTSHITEIGGVSTTPYAPQSVTVPLTAGTYYFLDVNTINNPPLTPVYHQLRATGKFRWSRLPRVDALVHMSTEPGLEFHAPSSLAAKGNFLAFATGDELSQVAFRPVVPGTTDAYIDEFYEAVRNGTTRPPSPWTGAPVGMQALSPGRWAIMHLDLPPGPYALTDFVPSNEPPGWPHTYIGMHKVITLTP
jgi:hypothetical protein